MQAPATQPVPRASGIWRGALACALVAALVRIVVILLPPADLSWGGQVWNEEWLRGNVAWEILHGPVVPLQDHALGLWGGLIVVGVLAVPWFALFGPVLPALRLACLPFPMLEAAAAFALLHRIGGARAAWCGALLVAVAPPGPVLDSVLAQGTHQHMHALVLSWMWLAARTRDPQATWKAHALLGLALGLVLYFGGSALLALAVLFELVLDRAWWRDLRAVAARAAGLAVGALPLAFARAQTPEGPMGIYGHGPAGLAFGGGANPLARLAELYGGQIPDAFWVRGPAGHAVGVAWMLVLLALWGIGARSWWQRRDPVRTALFAYPLVFTVVWAFSPLVRGGEDHVIAVRYVMPLLSVLAVTSGLGLARVARERPKLAAGVLAALLALSAGTLAPKLQPAAARGNWSTPGARPEGVARIHLWRNGPDPAALRAFLARVDARRAGAEREALLAELRKLAEIAAQARTRARERGGDAGDPAPWWALVEALRADAPR